MVWALEMALRVKILENSRNRQHSPYIRMVWKWAGWKFGNSENLIIAFSARLEQWWREPLCELVVDSAPHFISTEEKGDKHSVSDYNAIRF